MSPAVAVSVAATWSAELRGPRVVAGASAFGRLAEEVRALGGRRVLLVTDAGLLATGWPARATRLLEEAGVAVTRFAEVGPNPGDPEVAAGAALAHQAEVDLIVAVGGGSVLDAAKGIAFVHAGGGRVADYRGHGRARGQLLPMIAVPTTAGTGSEAQSYAVLTDTASGAKMACGDVQAMFRTAILDPETLTSAPRSVVVAATLDALSHAIESQVSRRANPFSRAASREAFAHLDDDAPEALAGNATLEASARLQLGAFLAGRAIELSMLGAAHACANPLTRQCGMIHGLAVAVMLPAVIRLNGRVADAAYAELMPGGAAALAARIERLLEAGDVLPRLRDHGVAAEAIPALALDATTQWTGTFNPIQLDESGFAVLYRSAW